MNLKRALVVGCGYVGGEVARRLVVDGWQVTGVTRSGNVPTGVTSLALDVADSATVLPKADLVVYGVSPSGRGAAAYHAAYVDGARCALEARVADDSPFVLLSSTGIFGASDGSWVDEETLAGPQTDTGKVLEVAESAVLAAGGAVLRLGGIYGPRRTGGLTRALNGGTRYVNRIHRDDAAAAAVFLAATCWPEATGQVFLGVDSRPAPADEIQDWLRERVPQAQMPIAIPRTHPPRHGSHKRCRNKRLLELGFQFQYPSYEEGYATLLDEWLGK